jgi:hypothetical protein
MASPEICPNCGTSVPRNAKSCPECGSCEETGWSEQTRADGLGLPEEEFDYKDFTEREFGGKRSRPRGISRFWWVVGIAALALFVFLLLR